MTSSRTPGAKAKVIVVDDHPVVRQGLVQLINAQPDLAVCGEAETVDQALREIVSAKPDIAVIDLSLKDGSGLELTKDVKVRCPDVPVLILSMYDETLYAERALRAGARGYIMKEENTESVLAAVRQVLAGKIYLSHRMTSRLLNMLVDGRPKTDESPVSRLSDRELQVFQFIGRGMGTRDISKELHLSIKTIESYRAHLKEKLNLKNATELQFFAIQWAQKDTSQA